MLTVIFPAGSQLCFLLCSILINHVRGDDNPNHWIRYPAALCPTHWKKMYGVACQFHAQLHPPTPPRPAEVYVDMFAHKQSASPTEIGIDSQRLLLIIKGNPTSS
jgi:hypothetical protein